MIKVTMDNKTEKKPTPTGGAGQQQGPDAAEIQNLVESLNSAFLLQGNTASPEPASSSADQSGASADGPLPLGKLFENMIFPKNPKHAAVTSQNVFAKLLHSLDSIDSSLFPDVVNSILQFCNLTPADVVQVVLGNSTPLQGLQQQLKEVISRELLNENPATEVNIQNRVEFLFSKHPHVLEKIEAGTKSITTLDDIDLPATIEKFLKLNLECMVKFCMENSGIEKVAYGDEFYKQIRRIYHEILVLGNICFEQEVLEHLIMKNVTEMTAHMEGLNPVVQYFTGPFAPMIFQHIRSTIELRPADVAMYVVRQQPSGTSSSPQDFDLD